MSLVTRDKDRLTKRGVERRLRDWKSRVEALFKQVEEWSIREWGENSVERGAEEQVSEYPMQEAGVRPRKLPTLTIRAGDRRITFSSSRVWIVGANGRIDVGVDGAPYTVVDLGGRDGEPSDWQIVNRDPRVVLEPFTQEVFLRIATAR